MQLRWLILLTSLVLLAGCGVPPLREMPDDPNYAPFEANSALPEFHSQGSIQYARFGTSLFSDRRASQIGDIITVRLTEKTQASKDADTQVSKNSGVQFNPGLLLGDVVDLDGRSLETNLKQDRDFKGEAQSSQSNSLSGNIAVSVIDVLPNGLLRVRGEKWLQLNRGSEYIRLTGLLRQEDVGPDNSVASTQLADARIGYSGTGELAQSNNMGWLNKFFNGGWWPL